MNKLDLAVRWAIAVAKDDSHGYDQGGHRTFTTDAGDLSGLDYDCSSLVISAFQQAGVPVYSGGASYTGNMRSVFLKTGFSDVTSKISLSTGSGLIYGDVMLHEGHHTAIYIGNSQIVHASINELGKITGGKIGDQTGKEICVRSYYNHPWNVVLRYTVESATKTEDAKPIAETKPNPVKAIPSKNWISELQRSIGAKSDGIAGPETLGKCPLLKRGSTVHPVYLVQSWLNILGYPCSVADSIFGNRTESGVRAYQKAQGVVADGIVGRNTWAKILGL
ncbi:peptidoglycan-binding protein [Lachnospiraceae bacterium ZAX-1]